MSNLQALQVKCLENIELAFTKAEAHFSIVIPRVQVKFSNKMTSTAGLARARYCNAKQQYVGTSITLSNQLMHANPEEFVKQTPGHETAHIIDYFLNGASCHGRNWKQIMSVIGLQAKRTHQMERPQSVLKNRVEVFCGCEKGHQITKQRANKMRRGYGYKCNNCKQSLRLNKESTNVPFNKGRDPQIDAMLAELAATTKAATKPKAKTKGGSKAERVREIIRSHPQYNVERLIELVKLHDIIPAGNVKKYVTENVKRVRG